MCSVNKLFSCLQKEEAELKAKEEAEKAEQERLEKAKRDEEERIERKKVITKVFLPLESVIS